MNKAIKDNFNVKNILSRNKLAILVIIGFLLANIIWVVLDNRSPMIGDDARYLQGTYELYQPIFQGDFSKAANVWSDMFIHADRFPRPPLFAVAALPSFLIFGVSENTAIITNCFYLALSGLLILFVGEKLFAGVEVEKRKRLLFFSVLLYNLMPGVYSFGRLYMSEPVQSCFVLILTYLALIVSDKPTIKRLFVFGVISGLGILLRFNLPMFLLIQGIVLVYTLAKKKLSLIFLLKSGTAFLIGFLPLVLTWYGKHLTEYLDFVRNTSFGELTKYYSLGPVWDPRTVLRYWYVIVTWMAGWQFIAGFLGLLLIAAVKIKSSLFTRIKGILQKLKGSHEAQLLLYLLIIPLPALLILTLSEGKTARYFVPVLSFYALALGYLIVRFLDLQKLWIKSVFILFLLVTAYPFADSLLGFLPRIPLTEMSYAAQVWDSSRDTYKYYDAFYATWVERLVGNESKRIYLIGEEPSFNEAELVWNGTQRRIPLTNTAEFSRYSDINEGKKQVDKADIIVVDTNPDAGELWSGKYKELRDYVANKSSVIELTSVEVADTSTLIFYLNVK